MDTKKVLGVALLIGGVGVAGAVIYYSTKKSRSPLLGRGMPPESVETEDGYKLTHHRQAEMPIKDRIAILQDLTAKSVRDPRMRKIALQMARHCKERDASCEAKGIYSWMKRNVRYTGDIGPHALWSGGPVEGVDLFQSAYRTVEFGGGDCDDHAILACTAALLNGMSCKYRVTSPRRGKQDDFTHIYAMIGLPKMRPTKYVAVDTTLPGQRYGVEAPHAKKLDFVA